MINLVLYKGAGVILSDIIPDQQVQLNLFDKYDVEKRTKLMKVYDDINRKMGEGTIRLSIQGIENKWGEKQAPISFGH